MQNQFLPPSLHWAGEQQQQQQQGAVMRIPTAQHGATAASGGGLQMRKVALLRARRGTVTSTGTSWYRGNSLRLHRFVSRPKWRGAMGMITTGTTTLVERSPVRRHATSTTVMLAVGEMVAVAQVGFWRTLTSLCFRRPNLEHLARTCIAAPRFGMDGPRRQSSPPGAKHLICIWLNHKTVAKQGGGGSKTDDGANGGDARLERIQAS
ncbi:hypothetical protein H4582DRAFT_2062501 [Lactarius indigo]|nr:hypothetical protein H4582DRAFT_2062501 [Lactarius indigo]